MNKFLEKNKTKIDELNSFIDNNFDNISQILVSCEMYECLKSLIDFECITEYRIRYKKIRVVKMPYYPAHILNFTFKDKMLKFELPCVCGIWKDEHHP